MRQKMNVEIFDETSVPCSDDGWTVCLQRVRYPYSADEWHEGYRFMLRNEDSNMVPLLGGARIPSLQHVKDLVAAAEAAGWGHFVADPETNQFRADDHEEAERRQFERLKAKF